ncbi:MAG: calcium-binding protein, partial [Cyanothece sp. SIO1E1]|nr:calcium-binding protein [Cyanothece sp. SIO1E1]
MNDFESELNQNSGFAETTPFSGVETNSNSLTGADLSHLSSFSTEGISHITTADQLLFNAFSVNQIGNQIEGTAGNDLLLGTSDHDLILGLAGNDSLIGKGGNDALEGLAGADSLLGGVGNDSLSGGDGNDTLAGGAGDDILQSGGGVNVIDGGEGVDTAVFSDIPFALNADLNTDEAIYVDSTGVSIRNQLMGLENLVGNDFKNQLVGDAGANVLSGAGGADTLAGGLGDDALFGGDGADILRGDLNKKSPGGTKGGNDTIW